MERNRVENLRKELRRLANPEKAVGYMRFFKTAPGEYGHGDKFYGIKVPDQRKILKKYTDLSFEEIDELLHSPFHEERFIALQILVHQFQKAHNDKNDKSGKNDEYDKTQKNIFEFYISRVDCVNNWDLVDTSAVQIVGEYLFKKPRGLLFEFANSSHLWKKRISIMATFYFIRKKDFSTTFEISEILLNDPHDLIHKAVGWMLREVANRDLKTAAGFLEKHAHEMPRTMLRYAVEKFPEDERKKYLGVRSKSLSGY